MSRDVYDLNENELLKTPTELYEEAMEKPLDDWKKMEWGDFLDKYDKYSLKDYLKLEAKLSNGAIEMIGE
jgi:hypothetical protein